MSKIIDMKVDIDVSELNSANYINNLLLETQESWARRLYSKLAEKYKNKDKVKLSCAFSFGVSDDYTKAAQKIMVIGQEANDHTCEYEKWHLEAWQKWAVAYLEYQLDINKENEYGIGPNCSPFWQFLNKLKDEGFGICWNNLDKVRRYVKKDGKGWIEDKLPYDKLNSERAILNKKIFDADSKSLLQKEIEIATPNIVVFAVGPKNPYYHTLCLALLDGEDSYNELLDSYPKKVDFCVDITKKLNLGIPAFYIYHPNYLNQSGKLDATVAKITSTKI